MSKTASEKLLDAAKKTIIAGYAVSLLIPYRVERHNGEITYHAPIYKLSYKGAERESTGESTPPTYTVTSFGLLCDQIATAKRLYTAMLFKKPYYKEKAWHTITRAEDRMGDAISKAKQGARRTADKAAKKAKKAKEKLTSVEKYMVRFVEDIID